MCFNLIITFSNSNYIINLYARYVSYLNFGMKIVLHQFFHFVLLKMWTFFKFILYNVSSFLSTMGLFTSYRFTFKVWILPLFTYRTFNVNFLNLKGQWTLFIFLMKFFINWIVSHNEVFRLDKVKELTNLLKNSCFSKEKNSVTKFE